MKPDICDLLILAGLALAGGGMWIVAPWAALLMVGTAVFALGLLGSYRKSRLVSQALRAEAAARRGGLKRSESAKESHGNS